MRRAALTHRQIRYAVRQRGKGRTLAAIAGELGVTPQHVGRLCAEFERTGAVHVQRGPGRRALPPPARGEVETVVRLYAEQDVGVVRSYPR